MMTEAVAMPWRPEPGGVVGRMGWPAHACRRAASVAGGRRGWVWAVYRPDVDGAQRAGTVATQAEAQAAADAALPAMGWRMPLDGLRGLTLWPEWAHAVFWYGKRIENRTWAAPPPGTLLALHAGARAIRRLQMERWADVYRMARRAGEAGAGSASTDPICSAIVGLIRIVGCDAPGEGDLSGWRAPQQFGWRFELLRIGAPVPCRGALGLWRVPQDVLAKIDPLEAL